MYGLKAVKHEEKQKMRKETLFLLAGVGLFLISIISVQPAEKVKIDSIKASDIGAKVTVTGNISKSYSTNGATFVEIKDNSGKIEGVAFNNLALFEGSSRVTGRVDLYQGQLQLIVEDATPEL